MRWKRALMIGAIAVVAGGAAAGGALLLTYHETTKIDRSNPEVVLIRYLDATFERKDPAIAGLYTCANPKGRLSAIASFQSDLDRREKEFGVSIQVSNGRMTTTEQIVGTDLTITATKNGPIVSEWVESWRFHMVDEDGWRVCGAERLTQPSASPSPPSVPSASASAVPGL